MEFISEKPIYLLLFRIAFLIMVMVGAMSELELIWSMADLFMGMMATVNLIAIAILGRIAFKALKDYQTQRDQGDDPVFYRNSIEGLKNIESWDNKPEKNTSNK